MDYLDQRQREKELIPYDRIGEIIHKGSYPELYDVGVLYPVEIKLSGNPKAIMGSANQILDKIPDKQRGMGVILCLVEKKTYLRENLIALPIEYL